MVRHRCRELIDILVSTHRHLSIRCQFTARGGRARCPSLQPSVHRVQAHGLRRNTSFKSRRFASAAIQAETDASSFQITPDSQRTTSDPSQLRDTLIALEDIFTYQVGGSDQWVRSLRLVRNRLEGSVAPRLAGEQAQPGVTLEDRVAEVKLSAVLGHEFRRSRRPFFSILFLTPQRRRHRFLSTRKICLKKRLSSRELLCFRESLPLTEKYPKSPRSARWSLALR